MIPDMPFISSKACYYVLKTIIDNIVYFSGLMVNCIKNTIKSKLIVWCGGGGFSIQALAYKG
jgi:hypothetical protein